MLTKECKKGQLTPDEGDKDLFVHASEVEGGEKTLEEGFKVEYTKGESEKGPHAEDVQKVAE